MADIEEIARDVVEGNRTGDMTLALDKHSSKDLVSVEAMDGPMSRVEGLDAVHGKGEWWMANNEVHSTTADGPYINGDQFLVRYQMDVTPKGGDRVQMDELGLYTVKDGKIVEERFFYGR